MIYVSISECQFGNLKGSMYIQDSSLLVSSTWETRPPVRKLIGEYEIRADDLHGLIGVTGGPVFSSEAQPSEKERFQEHVLLLPPHWERRRDYLFCSLRWP